MWSYVSDVTPNLSLYHLIPKLSTLPCTLYFEFSFKFEIVIQMEYILRVPSAEPVLMHKGRFSLSNMGLDLKRAVDKRSQMILQLNVYLLDGEHLLQQHRGSQEPGSHTGVATLRQGSWAVQTACALLRFCHFSSKLESHQVSSVRQYLWEENWY